VQHHFSPDLPHQINIPFHPPGCQGENDILHALRPGRLARPVPHGRIRTGPEIPNAQIKEDGPRDLRAVDPALSF